MQERPTRTRKKNVSETNKLGGWKKEQEHQQKQELYIKLQTAT